MLALEPQVTLQPQLASVAETEAIIKAEQELKTLLSDFLIHILSSNKIEGALTVPPIRNDEEAEWLVSSLEKLLQENFFKIHFELEGKLFPDGNLTEEQQAINNRFTSISQTLKILVKLNSKNF